MLVMEIVKFKSKQTALGCDVWYNVVTNRVHTHGHDWAPLSDKRVTNTQSSIQDHKNQRSPKILTTEVQRPPRAWTRGPEATHTQLPNAPVSNCEPIPVAHAWTRGGG